MIVSAASPVDLINWFHSHECKESVLCILMAPARSDHAKLTALISDVLGVDAILGESIGFLLLHPSAATPVGADRGFNNFAAFKGTTFPKPSNLAVPLQSTGFLEDLSDTGDLHRAEIAQQSTLSMARLVPDFMKLLGVLPNQLPALAVLVKGLDQAVVIPLSVNWDHTALLAVLRQIQEATVNTPNFNHEFDDLARQIPGGLTLIKNTQIELEAKRKHVGLALETVMKRHKATGEDLSRVATFLADDFVTTKDFDQLVAAMSFASTPRFKRDQQVELIRETIVRIERLRDGLTGNIACEFAVSISERVKTLVDRREFLSASIAKIRDARIVDASANGKESLKTIGQLLDHAKEAQEVGENAVSAFSWIRRLLTVAGLLG